MSVHRRVARWSYHRLFRPPAEKILGRLDTYIQRETGFVDEGMTAILEGQRDLAQKIAELGTEYQIPPLDRRSVAGLSWPVAELLNWANSVHGYTAQAGLWVNTGVQIAHHAGGVTLLSVNERVVEYPFCFQAVSTLPRMSRILDVGGAESTLGLSLASLGHLVTVVDPRGAAFQHPHLSVIPARLSDVDASESFDAAIALSTIEHFGRGSYGEQASDEREDLAATRTLRSLVKKDGILVLTVPVGRPSVDGFQRRYDADGIAQLVDGWEVEQLAVAVRRSATTWEPGDLDEAKDTEGVAMLVARNTSPEG